MMRHLVDLFFAGALIGVAILGIVHPVVVLRWAKRAHPELCEDDKAALLVTRLVGVGGLGVAVFFLVVILRSLRQGG